MKMMKKYLRVIVSDDLKSGKQGGNRILGMIKRNFTDRSRETIILLCKLLWSDHIDLVYHTAIWSAHCDKDIRLIESVQRKAIKLVTGMQGLQYSERLKR